MLPSSSARNLTPSSSWPASPESTWPGVVPESQIEQGQARGCTVTSKLFGDSRLALSSTARVLMVAWPSSPGVQR
jgi:hypothetical protein